MMSSKVPINAGLQLVENRGILFKRPGMKFVAEAPSPQDFPEHLSREYDGHVSFALFSMPKERAAHEAIKTEINSVREKEVDMGDLPDLVFSGQERVEQLLEEGKSYDVLVMCGKKAEAGLAPVGATRFSGSIKRKIRYNDGEISTEPMPMQTLQEAKYLAISDIGLIPKEAKGIKARVFMYSARNKESGVLTSALSFRYILSGTDDPTLKMFTLVGTYTAHGILYRVRGDPPGSSLSVTDLRAALGKPLVRRV